jgi:hypothetical protein
LAIGTIKAHTPRCKPVDIGRLHNAVTVTAQLRVQIIHHDKQDIGRSSASLPNKETTTQQGQHINYFRALDIHS